MYVWLKNEFKNVLPVFLYFFIFFTLISWIETYLFEEVGLTPFRFVQVLVAAALVAKIFVVVDHLSFAHLLRMRPLIYGILWKGARYWTLLLIISFAIRYFPYLFHGQGHFRGDLQRFFNGVNWHLFISIQVYYLMLIFNFVTFREVIFKIGRGKVKELFFR